MTITFDPAKRALTLDHRGLDMAQAGDVFDGPHLTEPDLRQDYGEERYITVGFLAARMVVVVWTPRDGGQRIISMRKANEREQDRYGRRLGRS